MKSLSRLLSVRHGKAVLHFRDLFAAEALLQAHKVHARLPGERLELSKTNGANEIGGLEMRVPVLGIALPDDADLEAGKTAQFLFPLLTRPGAANR